MQNDAAVWPHQQTGWFKEIGVKDLDSHSVRALLASLASLVKIKRDLENQIRGLLKNLGLAIGRPKFNVFVARAEELIEDRPELIAAVGPPTLILAEMTDLAEMLILSEIMSIAGSANRPRRAPRPSPLNRELNSRRTIVLCSRCRYMRGYWRAAACPRAAHKTATYRNLRSPTRQR